MSNLLYNISILLYRIAINIASIGNKKAKQIIIGKSNWRSQLTNIPVKTNHRVWFHCASLGEFEQGRPVIEGLKSHYPDISIVITFFSPSGYEVRKGYKMADCILYLPWDTMANAREFLSSVKPDIIVFIKYEFWRYFLEEANKSKIITILISGIFRPSQLFFKSYGKLYREVLHCFDHLFLQNQESKELLSSIEIENTTLAGDTRFDRVKSIADSAGSIEVAEEFAKSSKVLVAGSVWKEDLERIIPLINDPDLDLKYIIAPHEINPNEIKAWREKLLQDSILYSQYEDSVPPETASVLIIDNVGLLSRLYQYGSFAFVGGAYGPGLHNTLEAVTFGIPVFFGNKNYKKYNEALDLIERSVGYPLETSEELKKTINKFMDDTDYYKDICKAAKLYIDQQTGATNLILDYLKIKIRDL